jgi:hypothetical protein
MATSANISFYRGEDVTLVVTMNPVVDISGWSLQFTVRAALDLLPIAITKTVGAGITITNGPGGIFRVVILRDDTVALAVGTYLFDIQRIDSGYYTELLIGQLALLHPVSNIPP